MVRPSPERLIAGKGSERLGKRGCKASRARGVTMRRVTHGISRNVVRGVIYNMCSTMRNIHHALRRAQHQFTASRARYSVDRRDYEA